MSNKIGIVTVLYKSENVLPEFFESLAKQTFRNFVLYVVDNLSPDNSLQVTYDYQTTSNFPMVVIPNDDNYGVAKGNNIGIKQALADGCDYILLSNNDVTFDNEAIRLLLNNSVNLDSDLSVPKIYFWETDNLWFGGGHFIMRNGWVRHLGYLKKDDGSYNNITQISFAPTCFMLIKSSVFDKIGYMDEKYFVYWDDTDFVYRCLKNSFKLWYLPQSNIYHKESTSTGSKSDFSIYYLYRNFVYFTLKNRSILYSIYLLIANYIFHLTKNRILLNKSQWNLVNKAYIAGFKMFLN